MMKMSDYDIMDISCIASVILAADRASDLAKNIGSSKSEQAKIGIVTSELANNIVAHAEGKGRIMIKPYDESSKKGIVIVAEDKGPGIADASIEVKELNRKIGLGMGLGAVKRLVDELKIERNDDEGTRVVAKKFLVNTSAVRSHSNTN
jgi:serine/threonine-protein kinase RsbT